MCFRSGLHHPKWKPRCLQHVLHSVTLPVAILGRHAYITHFVGTIGHHSHTASLNREKERTDDRIGCETGREGPA